MQKRNDLAFVFPGQGAQYIGMAMDFVDKYAEVKQILLDFDRKHSTNLYEIMKDGPEELLKETRYTQPAILFHSIAAWEGFQHQIEIEPAFVAGHSLGEFTALVANRVLTLEDAMHLVHRRGEFMIKANEGNPFAMAAIMGLESDVVREICTEAQSAGIVVAANFNTPVQTVISGSQAGVELACEIAKAKGAKRALQLVVGGPFHSPMIAKAGQWLKEEMDLIDFKTAQIPVVSNVDAKPVTDPAQIKNNLTLQVTHSVLWVDCVKTMLATGVTTFVEFGPQKVLSGMIKNIDKAAIVLNIDKLEDIPAVIKEIKNVG